MTETTFTLEEIYQKLDPKQKKTKIVCTMGPSCTEIPILEKMLQSGMNVARLNFSHGEHSSHAETLQKVRQACENTGILCSIMLDTKGPEIRTGFLQDHKNINLKAGQELLLTTDYTFQGNSSKISISYPQISSSVKVGGPILIADGTLVCTVLELLSDGIKVRVENDCSIGEKKNVNLPGCFIDIPTVTEKDKKDILEFGLKHNIDCIALSFTRKASDIKELRQILGEEGKHIRIISKIENYEGLDNFVDILKETDGIMVARGDLGMEIPPSKVFVAQKWMIKKCNQIGKPVITATQMMESIIKNPRPTRAEASDVANAVLDGTDAVMLSGETANGSFPVVAVQTMAEICCEAENCIDYSELFIKLRKLNQNDNQKDAMAVSAVQMSMALNSPLIISFSASGEGVRLLSKYKPNAKIIAICYDPKVSSHLQMVRGVKCYIVPNFNNSEDIIKDVIKNEKSAKIGQDVVIITCTSSQFQNNSIRILRIQ